jgi:hypothetical protein
MLGITRTKALALFFGLTGLEIFSIFSTPVVNGDAYATFIVLLLAQMAVSGLRIIGNSELSLFGGNASVHTWRELTIISIATAIVMLPLAIAMPYDTNTKMLQLTSETGLSNATVTKPEILAAINSYSKENPAHDFLTQYYLLPKKDGNTKFVWDIVKKRAAYVSKLYHEGKLDKYATIPNFGFLHINKDSAYFITNSDNRLKSNDTNEFYSKRRYGYGVRYANEVIHSIQNDIARRSLTYNYTTNALVYLKSIDEVNQKQRLQQVQASAKALGISVSDARLNNFTLGSHKTNSQLLRSLFKQPH